MREILFRGIVRRSDYAEHVGKWVYGNLIRGRDFATKEFLYDIHDTESSPTRYERVEPDTVGQYTGLQDKNGVKIFEGDIVRKHEYLTEVIYEEGSFWLREYPPAKYMPQQEPLFKTMQIVRDLGKDGTSVEFVVIGNTHDNPELLEVKK